MTILFVRVRPISRAGLVLLALRKESQPLCLTNRSFSCRAAFVHDFEQIVIALFLHLFVDLLGHFAAGVSRRGEYRNTNALSNRICFHQIAGLPVIFLRFTGKPDNDVGA